VTVIVTWAIRLLRTAAEIWVVPTCRPVITPVVSAFATDATLEFAEFHVNALKLGMRVPFSSFTLA